MTPRRRVTIPTSPWDFNPFAGDDPMPINPPKIVEKPVRRAAQEPVAKPVDESVLIPVSARTPLEIMTTRCFTGNLNASDLRYMALAVLQMQDELFELRERVRLLEMTKAPE